MFDYKLLEALDMVLRCGSFDAAAKRLHLTPSAISQRIRQLEERHGEVLLRRENPLCATATGEKLLAHVRQVRLLESELAGQLDDADGSAEWLTLRLGVNADSLALGLLNALSPLLAQQRLLLECVVDDEAYTLDLLRSGEVYGCISTQANEVAGCSVVPLGCIEYIGVARADFIAQYLPDLPSNIPLSVEMLMHAPAAVFGHRESLHRRLLRERWGLLDGQYPCHVIPESNALFAAAQAGFAYAVVPRQQAAAALAAGQLCEIAALAEAVPLYWHHWARQTRPAQSLGLALQAFAASHFQSPAKT
ncbi:ArgP/LysG family DNA-binding transcriptional regulator [Chitinibacter sp. FCG-7]|uniref:ArgP/LysG family DNA-binding transcriptional regulator n=1 Tax=Chitinibacter mangrovi TaxID=3153927 RepID=A0AAU7F9A9_9NEIS